jgi:hypothetical protein
MSAHIPFKDRYIPEPNTGCWLWIAAVSKSGYGASYNNGKQQSAHRMSWEIENGKIPEGMFVCHKCDEKTCVNPDHLFLGTPKDNMQDMINKGRRVVPSTRNRMRGCDWRDAHLGKLPTGEAHHGSKLTETDVLAIRASDDPGVILATKYNVSNNTISRVRRRLIWSHI